MDLATRQGVCRFCGQIGVVEAPDISQDQIDEMITRKCVCVDAQLLREEEQKQQAIRFSADQAKRGLDEIMDDYPTAVNNFLKSAVDQLAAGTFSKISVKVMDNDTNVTMTRKNDGYIKVTRKDSSTQSIG